MRAPAGGGPNESASPPEPVARLDLRAPLLALGAWGGALIGLAMAAGGASVAGLALGGVLLAGCAATAVRWRADGRVAIAAAPTVTAVAVVAVAATLLLIAVLRAEDVGRGPIADLAARRATASLHLVVTDDPHRVPGRFGDIVVVRAQVRMAEADRRRWRLRAPVVVLGDAAWGEVALGSTVEVRGRLAPADGDAAALVDPRGPPQVVAAPDLWWRVSAHVRAALRASVADRPPEQAGLVPALVDGDDASVPPDLAADFRTTGLTHLLAVSGTNLTLLLAAILTLARLLGVRGRWSLLLGALTIAAFVVLARTEPSVLRAAVMGAVALVAFGPDARRRGPRALGVAVVVLLLLDPRLAVSAGFALSVLATAGILLLAPAWCEALGRWLPRWAAEAIAVPVAAQVACTPIVAALSGQVSLVAVAANLMVAPVVGPATVIGLIGGLVHMVWPWAGGLLGTLAGWCVAWIVVVARHGADLPMAALDWRSGPAALTVLALLCVVVAVAGPRLVSTRVRGGAVALALVVVVLVRPPTPGWPPSGWVLVACDVGQGDGLVLRGERPGSAVVVDVGPDPQAIDRCLRDLGVRRIELIVLTHFHADHVDGLVGAVDGRTVGGILVTTLLDPPGAVDEVEAIAAADAIPVHTVTAGERWRTAGIDFTAVWPEPGPPHPGPGDGSTANNASVVLLALTHGLRVLLTGDLEPDGQARLADQVPGLRVDVLKVPHHGSRYQDVGWLTSLRARLAVISVGADNDYGHPAPETVEALESTGTAVLRTDRDGAVAVTVRDGSAAAVTRP